MIGERCKSYHVRYSNILFGKYPQIAVEKTLGLTQKVSHAFLGSTILSKSLLLPSLQIFFQEATTSLDFVFDS